MSPWYIGATAEEILERLSVRMYDADLTPRWADRLEMVPPRLRDLLLYLSFDTEVSMAGILGFIENYPGKYLLGTAEMFDRIGARRTAAALYRINERLAEAGASWQALRDNFAARQEYEIVTFGDLHGKRFGELAPTIIELANELYVHQSAEDVEAVEKLMARQIEEHREEVEAGLEWLCA